MRHLKTEAIILDTTDVFDADRSFLLFTYELGKMRARARGVRKPTSKLTGHLLAYLPTQLEIAETKGNFLITQAQVVSEYIQEVTYPHNSLLFVRQAGIIAETINRLYTEQEAHKEVYQGLIYTLDRLRLLCAEEGQASKAALVTAEFLLKALGVLGYQVELQACVATGNPIKEEFVGWSSQLGGVLSEEGYRGSGGQAKLVQYPRSIVVLRQLLRPEFTAERMQLSNEIDGEVCRLIYDYVQTQIGQPLRALQ